MTSNCRYPLLRNSFLLLLMVSGVTTQALAQTSDSADLTAIAEEAYLYGLPMIVNYKVIYDYNVDRDSGDFKATFNQISSDARVFTPKDTTIVTPNSDTPYSMAQLDLRAEPMVLCMPDMEKTRYYDVQLVDMYTFNYGYMGSRTTGNGAGCYMVAGPDWKGEVPKGVSKVFRSETQFSFVIYRTQLFNSADMDNVKRIQAGYKVEPLSAFSDQPAPPAVAEIKWPEFSPDAFTTRFGEYLNFILQFCPTVGTAEVEKPLRERFAKIGIGAQFIDSSATPSAEMKAELGAGIKQAMAKIGSTAENVGTLVNGWQIGSAAGSREFYSGNWALRAAAAKLGIYGNSAAEAVYPFTRNDLNGIALDGSKRDYQMTFAPGQLPPVNAFWSITMYDSRTQLLVDNPINRYLINSPMLSGMEKNADGSLTVFIQKDSPGKNKEANWLPAPDGPIFIVMRLYWPKSEQPSVYPLGKGTWKPPGIVPITYLNAEKATRFGDKSLENTVRTDDRYGHDPLFHGPRGWPYWNYLEYPKPIQNPNLWPDMQSTYFLARLVLPVGGSLMLDGTYPRGRYLQYALYRAEHSTLVAADAISGPDIAPNTGSTNPYRVGANRLENSRDYGLRVITADVPAKATDRQPNTLYAGKAGGELQLVIRTYLPDQGMDGVGWGPAVTPSGNRGLPTYAGALADGTKLDAAQVIEQFARPMDAAIKQPLTDAQWIGIVNAKGNDPTLDPATAPARKQPKWEKFWTLKYSVMGAFKSPEALAKIPYKAAMEGGGDPSTQYFITYLSRKFGPVYVMRGKMPTFPDTFAGVGGRGLEVMPDTQTKYWSVVSCEAAPSGQIVDGVSDMQVPLDKDRNYTIVVSRKEDRPKNATLKNGVAWLEWSPRGEGLNDPRNRKDFGMLMLRIMDNNPSWKQSPEHVTEPGMEATIMGSYLPRGEYTDKATFEASGTK